MSNLRHALLRGPGGSRDPPRHDESDRSGQAPGERREPGTEAKSG
jgi:hypothetical protein